MKPPRGRNGAVWGRKIRWLWLFTRGAPVICGFDNNGTSMSPSNNTRDCSHYHRIAWLLFSLTGHNVRRNACHISHKRDTLIFRWRYRKTHMYELLSSALHVSRHSRNSNRFLPTSLYVSRKQSVYNPDTENWLFSLLPFPRKYSKSFWASSPFCIDFSPSYHIRKEKSMAVCPAWQKWCDCITIYLMFARLSTKLPVLSDFQLDKLADVFVNVGTLFFGSGVIPYLIPTIDKPPGRKLWHSIKPQLDYCFSIALVYYL